jgi:hypothetical protein
MALLLVASPMVVFGSSMLRRFSMNSAASAGSSVMTDHFADIVGDALRTASSAAVTFGFVLLLGGGLLFLAGGAYFVRRYITEISAILFRTRLAIVFWSIVAYGLLLVFHGGVRFASLEIVRVLVASATVLALSILFLIKGERGANRLTRALIIGPALLSAIFLSLVAGMFASTMFSTLIVQVTETFVNFMLQDALAIVGLHTFLISTFELAGVAYMIVWVGVTFVAGWALGAALVAFDISVTDAFRRFVQV